MSTGVGSHRCQFLAGFFVYDGHLHLSSTSTVVEAYVAGHTTGILTVALLHGRLAEGDAFTVVHRANLIFIVLHGRYGLVLVAQIVDVGSYLLPGVIALAYLAAQHGEVVNHVAVGIPTQHDAALAGLRHQGLLNLTIIGMIEVRQCRLGDRIVLRFIHGCGNRIDGITFQLPAAAEILLNICLSDSHIIGRFDDRHHIVVDNLPVVGTQSFQHFFCGSCVVLCGHHRHGLTIDNLPRIGLIAVHQVNHLILIGLVVVIYFVPVVPGNSETAAIGSPRARIIPTVVLVLGCGRRTIVIDTVQRPIASVAPSDDFACI